MQQRAAVQSISRFGTLSETYAQFLRTRIQRLHLTPAPDTLLQEAKHLFQQALENEGEKNPTSATLHRVGAMASLEVLRRAKKQKEAASVAWVELPAEPVDGEGRQQKLPLLQATLAQLPDQRRRGVALHLLELSEAEIASLLGLSEAKTRHQIERGLRSLRAKLGETAAKSEAKEADLRAIFQSQPSRAELNRADCLADEFLARVCTDAANAEDRAFVADHLTTCLDCAEEYQLVHGLKSWASDAAKRSTESSDPEFAKPVISEADTDQDSQPVSTEQETDQIEVSEAVISKPEAQAANTQEFSEPAAEVTPKWWQALIPRFFHYTGFNLFTAALTGLFLITSISLAIWLIALHFKHKTQLAQLQQQLSAQPPSVSAEPATPESLQARIEEAQKQLSDIQNRITEQNADKVLSNQELLGIQNDTLLKELEDLSKPQLDAPVVEIDPAALRATAEPGKEIVTVIDVPNTSSVFTVILPKPADKNAANYLLELFDAKKPKALWSAQKKLEAQTKIAVTLAKRNYPAGKYRFTLSGVEGKKKELLETYQIEVKYQPPPKQKKKK